MGRLVDVDQLVGSAEIARRLGLARHQHVHWWRKNDRSFPAPVVDVSTGNIKVYVWYWPDVETWARQTGRLPTPARRTRKRATPPE